MFGELGDKASGALGRRFASVTFLDEATRWGFLIVAGHAAVRGSVFVSGGQRYEEALGEAGEVALVAMVVATPGLVAEADTGVRRGAVPGGVAEQ